MNNSRIEKLAQMKRSTMTSSKSSVSKTIENKKTTTSSVRDIINRRLHKIAEEANYNEIYSKYSSYANLSKKTPEELLNILAKDIQEVGTVDDGTFATGKLQINAIGFFLGMNSIDNPTYIYSELKGRLASYGNELYEKETLQEVLEYEEKGSYETFIQAIEDGKVYKNYLNSAADTSADITADSPKIQESRQNLNRISGSGSGSNSNGDKTDVIKEELWRQTVPDNDYTYTIGTDGKSFSWTSKDNSKPGTHKQGDKNWGIMVSNLNKLAAPAAAAPEAAPAAAAPEAAPAAAAKSENTYTSEEALLAQVLQKMYDNKLVGTPGLDLRNEVRVTKIIMDGAALAAGGTGVGQGQKYANAAARILLSKNSALAGTIKGADYNSLIKNTEFLGSLQQAINGLYKTAFTWSKSLSKSDSAHAGFWKRIKSKSFDEQTASSIVGNYIKQALKFSTASSNNNKFVKAAKLRRLKVRSQMESAIDSSAQMGRSRI